MLSSTLASRERIAQRKGRGTRHNRMIGKRKGQEGNDKTIMEGRGGQIVVKGYGATRWKRNRKKWKSTILAQIVKKL